MSGLCIPEGVKTVDDLVNAVIYAACMDLYNDPEKCKDPKVLEEVARDFDPEEDWDEEWEEDEPYELPEDEEEETSAEDEEEAYEKYVKSVKEWCKERWGEHYKSFEECVESHLEDYEI